MKMSHRLAKTQAEVNFTRAIRCNVSKLHKLQVVMVCSCNLYADPELVTNEFKTYLKSTDSTVIMVRKQQVIYIGIDSTVRNIILLGYYVL